MPRPNHFEQDKLAELMSRGNEVLHPDDLRDFFMNGAAYQLAQEISVRSVLDTTRLVHPAIFLGDEGYPANPAETSGFFASVYPNKLGLPESVHIYSNMGHIAGIGFSLSLDGHGKLTAAFSPRGEDERPMGYSRLGEGLPFGDTKAVVKALAVAVPIIREQPVIALEPEPEPQEMKEAA